MVTVIIPKTVPAVRIADESVSFAIASSVKYSIVSCCEAAEAVGS